MSSDTRVSDLLICWEDLRDQGVPTPTAEELCADCPELVPELRRQITALEHVDGWMRYPEMVAAADTQRSSNRYRTLHLHARGGLGEVYLARDEELRRDVALKRMQPSRLWDAESRRRFLREAEITARLEHPGIVPLYGLVDDADGQPCYAMRFVRGETLDDALRRYHTAAPAARFSVLRQLLNRFVTVCNTVAYAHSQGVVHRDIKPANVLLGPYGETLLVDWGLAKQMAGSRSDTKNAASEQTSALLAGSVPFPTEPTDPNTLLGQALGTPAYMSPEQAAGDSENIGVASDIYSLGATLYTLLAGRAAVQGRDPLNVLEQVRRGNVVPLRQVRKDIPPALERICQKAMARQPHDRYVTALDLAADVEHWLADEPVSVSRDPPWVRLGRWARHHRALSAGAAAILVAAVSFLSVLAVVLEHARERSAAEQLRTDEQRKRAQSSYRLALDAMTRLVGRFEADERLRRGSLEDLRRAALGEEQAFYEQFVGLQGDEPEFQVQRARAYFRLGTVTEELASKDEALAHFGQAVGIFSELADVHPDVPEYRSELANANVSLGHLRNLLGATLDAERAYEEARATFQSLMNEDPTNPNYRAGLAGVLNNLGVLNKETGQSKDAEGAYGEAGKIWQALVREYPDRADYQAKLAGFHLNQGALHKNAARLRDAERDYDAASKLWEVLVRAHPEVAKHQVDLANCENSRGILYVTQGQTSKTEQAFRNALELRKKLARAHPLVDAYQADLAASHVSMANLFQVTGRAKEAAQAYTDAIDVQKALVRDHAKVPQYQALLAAILNNLGSLHETAKDFTNAERAYEEALAIQEELVSGYPQVPRFGLELGTTQRNLGNLFVRSGRPAASLAWYAKASATLQAVREREPQAAAARRGLRDTHWGWAVALAELKRHPDALVHWDQAIELDTSNESGIRFARAVTLARIGVHVQAALLGALP